MNNVFTSYLSSETLESLPVWFKYRKESTIRNSIIRGFNSILSSSPIRFPMTVKNVYLPKKKASSALNGHFYSLITEINYGTERPSISLFIFTLLPYLHVPLLGTWGYPQTNNSAYHVYRFDELFYLALEKYEVDKRQWRQFPRTVGDPTTLQDFFD